mmetsp:Transcript_37203/g.93297  ORF Transcript_37203/g.93297 Transcript_37203/m.93297 type:complete len:220 (+) Transcript_37203:205-864(+)
MTLQKGRPGELAPGAGVWVLKFIASARHSEAPLRWPTAAASACVCDCSAGGAGQVKEAGALPLPVIRASRSAAGSTGDAGLRRPLWGDAWPVKGSGGGPPPAPPLLAPPKRPIWSPDGFGKGNKLHPSGGVALAGHAGGEAWLGHWPGGPCGKKLGVMPLRGEQSGGDRSEGIVKLGVGEHSARLGYGRFGAGGRVGGVGAGMPKPFNKEGMGPNKEFD